MKTLALHLFIIIGLSFSDLSNAAEVSGWLENLKREITRLGINERGYLHSIGRLRNSVLQGEDLFFVSALRFEDLDIRLFPDGSVQVSSFNGKSLKKPLDGPKPNSEGPLSANCTSVPGNFPRLSLIKDSVSRSNSVNNLSSRENNLLIFMENYISSLVLGETNVALSPYFKNGSRYENLMRGSHFEEAKHKLLIRVEYVGSQQQNRWAALNAKYLLSREPVTRQIAVRLFFMDENTVIKEMATSFTIGLPDPNNSKSFKKMSNANDEIENLAVRIKTFLSELHCLADYSNLVVAVDGLLVLDSGTDAGLSEGDQLLLMPNSQYFRKRGLLSGVEQIAIARIKKINAIQSELEIEEGKVRLENGVEFFVRPLLELI